MLDCEFTPALSLLLLQDTAQVLASYISAQKCALRSFTCTHANISDFQGQVLFTAIGSNKSLTDLDLSVVDLNKRNCSPFLGLIFLFIPLSAQQNR